jgi:hypothetical protein
VVTGEGLPAGTSFKLGSMVNQNATKMFDFLREKLSLSLQDVFQDWIVDELMSTLNRKKVIRLTGNEQGLYQFYEAIINGWYINNLLSFPPHSKEQADEIKKTKLKELMGSEMKYIDTEKDWLSGVKPRVAVIISGENINLIKEMESLSAFIALEQDPIRRTALIEMAMRKQGINIDELPKTPPVEPQTQQMAKGGSQPKKAPQKPAGGQPVAL